MKTISILKIESSDGLILLSKNSKQEISPILRENIFRNINSKLIESKETQYKLKCTIESIDAPNFSLLKLNKKFNIYSIVEFFEHGKKSPSTPYVPDSVQSFDGFIKFRPLLIMHLISFKCSGSNNGENKWILEFEEP